MIPPLTGWVVQRSLLDIERPGLDPRLARGSDDLNKRYWCNRNCVHIETDINRFGVIVMDCKLHLQRPGHKDLIGCEVWRSED